MNSTEDWKAAAAESGKAPPESGAQLVLGVSKDGSVFALTIVTQSGQRHELLFPASTVRELHDQLADIMRKHPGIG